MATLKKPVLPVSLKFGLLFFVREAYSQPELDVRTGAVCNNNLTELHHLMRELSLWCATHKGDKFLATSLALEEWLETAEEFYREHSATILHPKLQRDVIEFIRIRYWLEPGSKRAKKIIAAFQSDATFLLDVWGDMGKWLDEAKEKERGIYSATYEQLGAWLENAL